MADHDWKDEIDRYIARMPEPKLELIDGRLMVGNGLVGSRHLLWEILCGYGTEAALALAPYDTWLQALAEGFASLKPPSFDDLSALDAWSKSLAYDPCILPAGPQVDGWHRVAQQLSMFGLSQAAEMGGLGSVSGRDIVMSIDPDAVTPDAFLVGRERRNAMKSRYCEGRADLVIEVLLRGHATQDADIKRRLYEKARIPEYWLIDPYSESIEFLRLTGEVYQSRRPGPDGSYRPLRVPGLSFHTARFWDCFRQGREFPDPAQPFFAAETRFEKSPPRPLAKNGLSWGDVPFRPAPDLLPRVLTFDEFACWCPEAKFEGDGRCIIVGSRTGTRNVLGMLLRSFGLIESARVVHPRQWVFGLRRLKRRLRSDQARRNEWWRFARQAAAMLRERFGWRRIAVIGDLTTREPLNYWSNIVLISLDAAVKSPWEAYRDMRALKPRISFELIDMDQTTGQERELVERGVEI